LEPLADVGVFGAVVDLSRSEVFRRSTLPLRYAHDD
jgi:hypothetical protein